jgi:zinc protease
MQCFKYLFFCVFFGACSTLQRIDIPKPIVESPSRVKGFQRVRLVTPFESFQGALYKHEKNGLEVLVLPQAGSKVFAYTTVYKVGSRNESLGQTGMAHLFEHMMFRGTPSFPEPFKTLSSWGDRSNATTSFDSTRYYILGPKEIFENLVQLESERMRKLTITEAIFNTERFAVVSERKMRVEDNPMGRLLWELYGAAYKKHPYRVLPIGYQADLDRMTFQQALDFHKTYYAPNNAVISVVGDVDFEEALSLIDRYYGDYEKVTVPEFTGPFEPTLNRKNQRIIVPQKAEAVMLGEARLGLKYADTQQVPKYALLCALLGGGEYGHLFEQLVREKKLASMAGASCEPSVDAGLNVIFVRALPGISAEKIEKALNEAFLTFPKFLNEKKLQRIKMLYSAGRWGNLRDPQDLGLELAENHALTGNALYNIETLKDINQVSLAEVRVVFEEFSKTPWTRVVLNPSENTKPIEGGGR